MLTEEALPHNLPTGASYNNIDEQQQLQSDEPAAQDMQLSPVDTGQTQPDMVQQQQELLLPSGASLLASSTYDGPLPGTLQQQQQQAPQAPEGSILANHPHIGSQPGKVQQQQQRAATPACRQLLLDGKSQSSASGKSGTHHRKGAPLRKRSRGDGLLSPVKLPAFQAGMEALLPHACIPCISAGIGQYVAKCTAFCHQSLGDTHRQQWQSSVTCYWSCATSSAWLRSPTGTPSVCLLVHMQEALHKLAWSG